jgi:hypothetical protein
MLFFQRANRPPRFSEVRSRLRAGVHPRLFKFAGSERIAICAR